MIGIERHIRVCQKYFQPKSPLARILERLREPPCRREPLPIKLPRDPVKERLDVWLAVSQPMRALVLAGELVLSDVLFDLIKRGNPLECLFDTPRLIRVRLEEFAAAMALIPRSR